jgi:hypothetical protein
MRRLAILTVQCLDGVREKAKVPLIEQLRLLYSALFFAVPSVFRFARSTLHRAHLETTREPNSLCGRMKRFAIKLSFLRLSLLQDAIVRYE